LGSAPNRAFPLVWRPTISISVGTANSGVPMKTMRNDIFSVMQQRRLPPLD
jgi:hypothetical protein